MEINCHYWAWSPAEINYSIFGIDFLGGGVSIAYVEFGG